MLPIKIHSIIIRIYSCLVLALAFSYHHSRNPYRTQKLWLISLGQPLPTFNFSACFNLHNNPSLNEHHAHFKNIYIPSSQQSLCVWILISTNILPPQTGFSTESGDSGGSAEKSKKFIKNLLLKHCSHVEISLHSHQYAAAGSHIKNCQVFMTVWSI